MKQKRLVMKRITGYILPAAVMAGLFFLVLLPPVYLFINSFTDSRVALFPGGVTLGNYIQVTHHPEVTALLANSLLFACGSACLACVIGITLAWLYERADLPYKFLIFSLVLIPLVVPGLLFTISWVFLLSPKTGIINHFLVSAAGLSGPPFNIYSFGGMIWVEGLTNTPLVFLLMKGIFSAFNRSWEEAAFLSGASKRQVFYFINLPLAKPALFSAWLLVFIKGFTEFDVPAVIGLPAGYRVITSHIYTLLRNYPVDYGLASAFSMLLVIIIILAVWLNKGIFRESLRYATIKGGGYRPPARERGFGTHLALIAVILYLFISTVLPFFVLLWSSLQPYYGVPGPESLKNLTFDNYVTLFRYPNISGAFLRSFWLSVTAGVIVMALSVMTGMYTVRSRLPGRNLLDGLVTLPMIFPGIVLGTAIILVYLRLPLPVYGTVLLLLIGYVTHGLPYGVRYTSAALVQIHPELEEAALLCGATKLQQVCRITLPLLRASLISGFLYIIVLTMRNLSIALLLYKPGSEVLSVAVWDLWNTGGYVTLSALGSLLIIILLILAFLAGKLDIPGFGAVDYRSGGTDVIDKRAK